MRRRIGSMLLVLCMMAGVLMTGCGADNAEKKKGVETISPKGLFVDFRICFSVFGILSVNILSACEKAD